MRIPRDYQCVALESIERELAAIDSTILVLATGLGKTVVMAKLASRWKRGNVLVLAHRIELLDQARDKFRDELGYEPQVEQGQRVVDSEYHYTGGKVVIGSVQTLCNLDRLAKFDPWPFGLVMIDECHHARAPSYLEILRYLKCRYPNLKTLGVTATPRRADDKAMSVVFESVAYDYGLLAGIQNGYLVNIRQEYVTVDAIDWNNISTTTNEYGERDLNPAQLEAAMIEEEPLHKMAVPIVEKAGGRQVLAFTPGVASAHLLCDILNRMRPGKAAAIDGTTPTKVRERVVEQYRMGELQYLVNYGVFTEGFDVAGVGVVAMGRPTKSEGLYKQMLGRGTRPVDRLLDGCGDVAGRLQRIQHSSKPDVLVIDFVGNSKHKLISTPDILGGDAEPDVRVLAKRNLANRINGDTLEELQKAKAELQLIRDLEKRRNLLAQVTYRTEEIDPFSREATPMENGEKPSRGTATAAQIDLLVGLGMKRDTAAKKSRGAAGAIIESMKKKRCTNRQRAILEQYGEDTSVNFHEASKLIDQIMRNGWRTKVPGNT